MVRHPPAQLLCHLVAQGFTALGVVGAHVDVDEGPGVVVGKLAAQPVNLVVGAVNRDKHRIVDRCADDLALLQVGWDEDHGADAGPGTVGGYAASQVAGGGAGDGLVAEFQGLSGRDGDHAVLEGERRVYAVVLDVQVVQTQGFAQPFGLEQRCESRHDVYGVVALRGEQVFVSPDAEGTLGDTVPTDDFRDGGVVVDHLQGPEAKFANV